MSVKKTVKKTTKKTTKKLAPIIAVYLLDESGSMSTNKTATMNAFNEYLKTLKGMDNVRFSLTKFNSSGVKIVYTAVDPKKVQDLDYSNYLPSDTTPLYDAIGQTAATLTEKTIGKSRVLFIIQTDGYENASKEYDRERIFNLVRGKRLDGWEFVFLGADIDSYSVGNMLGIDPSNVANYLSSVGSASALRGATLSYQSAVTSGQSTTGLVK